MIVNVIKYFLPCSSGQFIMILVGLTKNNTSALSREQSLKTLYMCCMRLWFIVIGEEVLTSLKVSYCIFDRYSKRSCSGLEGK